MCASYLYFICECVRRITETFKNKQNEEKIFRKTDSPHVDQILSQCNRIGIAANGDCSIGIAAAFTLFTIRDANHGARYLPNFSNFSATLPNNAADQVVWHCHFLLLRVGLRCSGCRRCTQL
jgi:hypothetical protein